MNLTQQTNPNESALSEPERQIAQAQQALAQCAMRLPMTGNGAAVSAFVNGTVNACTLEALVKALTGQGGDSPDRKFPNSPLEVSGFQISVFAGDCEGGPPDFRACWGKTGARWVGVAPFLWRTYLETTVPITAVRLLGGFRIGVSNFTGL